MDDILYFNMVGKVLILKRKEYKDLMLNVNINIISDSSLLLK